MKKQYIAPVTSVLDMSVENQILATSIEIGGNTDKFDAPEQREFGDLWGSKGW